MSNEAKVWLNGELISWSEAVVPLLSHGFSRASAIFDFFAVFEGPEGPMAFRMDEHLKRLQHSAELLEMRLAYTGEQIEEAVKKTVAANRMESGVIKIMAYWGQEAVLDLVLDTPLDVAIFAISDVKPSAPLTVEPITACLSKCARSIRPRCRWGPRLAPII